MCARAYAVLHLHTLACALLQADFTGANLGAASMEGKQMQESECAAVSGYFACALVQLHSM
jgi:hypothetical protein